MDDSLCFGNRIIAYLLNKNKHFLTPEQPSGELHLIYGVNGQSVAFGEKLRKAEKGFLVFVDDGSGGAFEAAVLRMGGLMLDSNDAKTPTAAFLRKIGIRPGPRRLMLYCLDDNDTKNLRYAESMLRTLEAAGIAPAQTALTVLLAEADVASMLQADGTHSGYGSVTAFERAELLARMMIRTWPPYQTIGFDEAARATEDFEALVIGFGATGQAIAPDSIGADSRSLPPTRRSCSSETGNTPRRSSPAAWS